ncbi:hypothetical protein JHK86_050510 [Glycine max]|nr:hypothetical protein JHK86_050510 [Glycine max]
MATMILWGKPYSCPTLKPRKNKGVARDKKFEYDFDISKVDQIFLSFDKGTTNLAERRAPDTIPKRVKGKERLQRLERTELEEEAILQSIG